MSYLLVTILGVVAGAVSVYVGFSVKRSALILREKEHEQLTARREKEHEQKAAIIRRDMEVLHDLERKIDEFESRVIAYKELQNENMILKRDLQNVDIHLRKLELDRDLDRQRHDSMDERTQEVGSRYLKDNVKWIISSLNANNFASSKQKVVEIVERCRAIGLIVTADVEASLVQGLKDDYEKEVRRVLEREEQARIKAQIREEMKLQKEIEFELKRLDRERELIETALKNVLASTQDEHSAEVEQLRARLAEAEQKSQRAMSRAQMTKAGHVYVISNFGSFGEGIFKVGMTRRLEPNDRIRELGDASVPFPFDVHMVVSSDDAPALENAIHRKLYKHKINKINPRKEFFRIDLNEIVKVVKEHHGEVEYIADAEALEYRQSVTMTEDDIRFVEYVYNPIEDDGQPEAITSEPD